MENSCVFFSQNDLPKDLTDLETRLRETIQALILRHGIQLFFIGNNNAFDKLVDKVLTELKAQYPDIILHYYFIDPSNIPVDLPADANIEAALENNRQLVNANIAIRCTAVVAYLNEDDQYISLLLDYFCEKQIIYSLGSYAPKKHIFKK